MRAIIGGLVISLSLGFFADVRAQPATTAPPALPPEIMADRYMVKAEQLKSRKGYAVALKVMDEVFAMQKEHDLKPPDEILFRYARIALSADSIRVALVSVNTYLVAAGQEGAFYKEALALPLKGRRSWRCPSSLLRIRA